MHWVGMTWDSWRDREGPRRRVSETTEARAYSCGFTLVNKVLPRDPSICHVAQHGNSAGTAARPLCGATKKRRAHPPSARGRLQAAGCIQRSWPGRWRMCCRETRCLTAPILSAPANTRPTLSDRCYGGPPPTVWHSRGQRDRDGLCGARPLNNRLAPRLWLCA